MQGHSYFFVVVVVLVCLFVLFSYVLRQAHYASLAGLDLVMQTRLTLNSPRTLGLCPLSAGIKGMNHYPEPRNLFSCVD